MMPRRAFTLVEMICAVVVVAVSASIVVPVVNAAIDNYAASRTIRAQTDDAAFALERIVRIIREAPPGVAPGTVGIETATPTSFLLADGNGFSLAGDVLNLTAGLSSSPLCRGVSAFNIDYLGEDGVTSTLAAPETTQRLLVTLRIGDSEFRVVAAPRTRVFGN